MNVLFTGALGEAFTMSSQNLFIQSPLCFLLLSWPCLGDVSMEQRAVFHFAPACSAAVHTFLFDLFPAIILWSCNGLFCILPSSCFRQHCYWYIHCHVIFKKNFILNIMHMTTNIYNYWIKFKTFCIQPLNGFPWAAIDTKLLAFVCSWSNPTVFT